MEQNDDPGMKNKSATARKLSFMRQVLLPIGQIPQPPIDQPDLVTPTKTSSTGTSEVLTGSRFMDVECLSSLINNLACPKCYAKSLILQEKRFMGLKSDMEIWCKECKKIVSRSGTSKVVGRFKTGEANLRFVAASKDCGIGFEKMVKFFGQMDIPRPLHLKSYQRLAKTVGSNTAAAKTDCFSKAADAIRSLYMSTNPELLDEDVINITVTYDGTWHKRGHSSHYGVGAVIELETGLVLDTEVLSNFCQNCSTAPSETSPDYAEWHENHIPHCMKNHKGSANSMEVKAAKVLFSRSVSKYNFQYTTVLCDGDAKTVKALNDIPVYDTPVVKEDCINHVAKRMYNGIDSLKKKLSGTPESITGRGKLTNKIQATISNFYANQLKINAPDVQKMRQSVYASLFHMVSTDEDPHHTFCPPGDKSWCHFQRSEAKQEPHQQHRPKMTKIVADKLQPLFERLTQPDLLTRCQRMKTQNANESFNAQIWRRCPKTEPSSLDSVRTAVNLASIDWNQGATGFTEVLRHMGISVGQYQAQFIKTSINKRINSAEKSRSERKKTERKLKKLKKASLLDKHEQSEGVTYSAGAFNV